MNLPGSAGLNVMADFMRPLGQIHDFYTISDCEGIPKGEYLIGKIMDF
jgi:hypothetical protein